MADQVSVHTFSFHIARAAKMSRDGVAKVKISQIYGEIYLFADRNMIFRCSDLYFASESFWFMNGSLSYMIPMQIILSLSYFVLLSGVVAILFRQITSSPRELIAVEQKVFTAGLFIICLLRCVAVAISYHAIGLRTSEMLFVVGTAVFFFVKWVLLSGFSRLVVLLHRNRSQSVSSPLREHYRADVIVANVILILFVVWLVVMVVVLILSYIILNPDRGFILQTVTVIVAVVSSSLFLYISSSIKRSLHSIPFSSAPTKRLLLTGSRILVLFACVFVLRAGLDILSMFCAWTPTFFVQLVICLVTEVIPLAPVVLFLFRNVSKKASEPAGDTYVSFRG